MWLVIRSWLRSFRRCTGRKVGCLAGRSDAEDEADVPTTHELDAPLQRPTILSNVVNKPLTDAEFFNLLPLEVV
jgi:hypothetical protein